MRTTFFTLLLFFTLNGFSASPTVPAQMEVAGIKLKLSEAARRDIQKDVDALTRSKKYFDIKMDRIRIYFPLIEQVFREENVPEDFKYLVIQESALIADAVSSSNAVGYWQFKEFTGKEVGLRIDRQIDERMHIIAASRGAAKYFKKNNFYFDNWLYALQAYQMGPGGALKVVDKKYFGASKMQINKKTYWYVKKFLAHKIAYEKAYKAAPRNGMMLAEYKRGADKSFREISRELDVEEEDLAHYNQWLRKGRIPSDKEYIVLVPIQTMEKKRLIDGQDPSIVANGFKNVYPNENPDLFPVIKDFKASRNYTPKVIKANGLPAIIAREGDSYDWLALQGAVPVERFRKYNDLSDGDTPEEGKVYYLKRKKGKARIHYHVVSQGETLWDVSQKYGIKLKKLMQKNRMREVEPLEEGRILWLRFIRPSNHPIEYKPVPVPEVIGEEQQEVLPVDTTEQTEIFEVDSISSPPVSADSVPAVTDSMQVEAELKDTVVAEVVIHYEEKKINHKVEKGETLYGISRNYGVPVDDVIRWNEIEITEDYRLSIGEQLIIFQRVPVEAPIEGLFYHRVQPGETLYQISRNYDLSVDELMELNELATPDISPGRELKIMEKSNPKPPEAEEISFHEVQSGETLYQIANRYGLSIQELMDLNQKEDFDLKIGEKLQVSR